MPDGRYITGWAKTSNKKMHYPGLYCNQIQSCCVCSVPTPVSIWERLLSPLWMQCKFPALCPSQRKSSDWCVWDLGHWTRLSQHQKELEEKKHQLPGRWSRWELTAPGVTWVCEACSSKDVPDWQTLMKMRKTNSSQHQNPSSLGFCG